MANEVVRKIRRVLAAVSPQQVAAQFSARFNGHNSAWAWGDANNAVLNTYWCVIGACAYFWHAKDLESGEWTDYAESY